MCYGFVADGDAEDRDAAMGIDLDGADGAVGLPVAPAALPLDESVGAKTDVTQTL